MSSKLARSQMPAVLAVSSPNELRLRETGQYNNLVFCPHNFKSGESDKSDRVLTPTYLFFHPLRKISLNIITITFVTFVTDQEKLLSKVKGQPFERLANDVEKLIV